MKMKKKSNNVFKNSLKMNNNKSSIITKLIY